MKKYLFIFLGLFSIFFFYDNVNALPSDSGTIEFLLNNTNFVNSNAVLRYNNTTNVSLSVVINSYNIYNYYIIYFAVPPLSNNAIQPFTISVGGGCTTNCFSSNYYIKRIGVITTYDYYAIVLPTGKQDCGVGTGQCIISNSIYLSSPEATNFVFLGVDVMDNDSILDNNYTGFLNVINNQTQSTQSIINNQTQNTQSIINNQNTNQQQTHGDLTNINDSLTNDNIPTDSFNGTAFGEWKDLLPSDTPITDLLLLPVNFLSAFIVGFGGTCQPFNLGNFFGTDLILPCINPATYLGSSLWTIIDIICSGLMCFAISKKLIKIWDDMTDMRDNLTNDLYGGGR